MRGIGGHRTTIKTLSQAQTAQTIGMAPSAFTRNLPDLLTNEGFPPPYIGDLNNGRKGPRRRWLTAAVIDWIDRRSQAIQTQPTPTPANDQSRDIAESDNIFY